MHLYLLSGAAGLCGAAVITETSARVSTTVGLSGCCSDN